MTGWATRSASGRLPADRSLEKFFQATRISKRETQEENQRLAGEDSLSTALWALLPVVFLPVNVTASLILLSIQLQPFPGRELAVGLSPGFQALNADLFLRQLAGLHPGQLLVLYAMAYSLLLVPLAIVDSLSEEKSSR
jgi:hypothetical protein